MKLCNFLGFNIKVTIAFCLTLSVNSCGWLEGPKNDIELSANCTTIKSPYPLQLVSISGENLGITFTCKPGYRGRKEINLYSPGYEYTVKYWGECTIKDSALNTLFIKFNANAQYIISNSSSGGRKPQSVFFYTNAQGQIVKCSS